MSNTRPERLECCPRCGQPLLHAVCFLCGPRPDRVPDPAPEPANDDAEATPPPPAA